MAKRSAIMEGLQILSKYYPEDDYCSAEHDVFFAGDNDENVLMSKEDTERLDTLGWFVDDEIDSWAIFT